ncbi:hypothetical protein PPACK8108_LOCUS16260 [Phakopsora pachyrhizi]|uniref:Uncharacterized protein n=1 Tax=Phakopsora pachyrhizi TaxID=170000 RepID=A0AAV0BBH0_PHAPC|nr:hypothetical protein PPACK8108_LOCUS16260 [Phakopsora pachyrhizi]
MDGTNGLTAQNVKPSGSAKYEHPISKTPTEDMDSGVSSKDELMVAVGIPSEQIFSAPRTSDISARANLMKHQAAFDLAQKEVEDSKEDLRNEFEPVTQKRKECMKEVIDLEDQSQGTRSHQIQAPIPTPSVSYSIPVNPPGHRPEIETGPSSLDWLSPGLGLRPWTFDHPSENVLEFENDKERTRRLLVNTHRLLGAHVAEVVKGASNHRYSEFVQRGQEMDGLLTHSITQLSDWYETLEVENYEVFEWDIHMVKEKLKIILE